MEVVVTDNWSYKSCKTPAKSSPPSNQYPTFYRPDAFPVAKPTVSKHWMEIILYCVTVNIISVDDDDYDDDNNNYDY